MELLGGNRALMLGGVEISAPMSVVFLNDDLCHTLYGFGANAVHVGRSLVKEQYGSFLSPVMFSQESVCCSILLILFIN